MKSAKAPAATITKTQYRIGKAIDAKAIITNVAA